VPNLKGFSGNAVFFNKGSNPNLVRLILSEPFVRGAGPTFIKKQITHLLIHIVLTRRKLAISMPKLCSFEKAAENLCLWSGIIVNMAVKNLS